MKIEIKKAKRLGYCWGVERAIKEAFKSLDISASVYLWGELIHNALAMEKLINAGLKSFIPEAEAGALVLGPTHGLLKESSEELQKKGFKIKELTCPIVERFLKKSQHLISSGYHLLILGDKNHSEIKYITSYLPKEVYTIFSPLLNIQQVPAKVALVVQTTKSLEDVKSALALLGGIKEIEELLYINTLCREILERQKEGLTLAREVDAMLVVGDKSSANSRRLFELISNVNPHTHFVSGLSEVKELEELNLKNILTIGVVSGASTPLDVIEEIVEFLNEWSS